MKKLYLAPIPLLLVILSACSTLPLKTELKEGHFQVENFKNDIGREKEYIHLMCFKKKPTCWNVPKQYLGGEHDLWVEARVSNGSSLTSTREAFVHFNVNLDAGKNYTLNRKLDDKKISIWIQEIDTGAVVSDIKTTDLKLAVFNKTRFRRKQCRTGSI